MKISNVKDGLQSIEYRHSNDVHENACFQGGKLLSVKQYVNLANDQRLCAFVKRDDTVQLVYHEYKKGRVREDKSARHIKNSEQLFHYLAEQKQLQLDELRKNKWEDVGRYWEVGLKDAKDGYVNWRGAKFCSNEVYYAKAVLSALRQQIHGLQKMEKAYRWNELHIKEAKGNEKQELENQRQKWLDSLQKLYSHLDDTLKAYILNKQKLNHGIKKWKDEIEQLEQQLKKKYKELRGKLQKNLQLVKKDIQDIQKEFDVIQKPQQRKCQTAVMQS